MTAAEKNNHRRKRLDSLFGILGLLATCVGLITLAALIVQLAADGAGRLTATFFTSFPSRFAGQEL